MTPPDDQPAIAVIPYLERLPEGLPNLPLDRLDWPLGRPARLAHGTVADMASTDHLITYPKTRLYFTPRGRRTAKLSLMIVEPDAVHAKHLRLARLFNRRFFRVLTKNEVLLRAIPNGEKFIAGFSFVAPSTRIPAEKTQMTSIIASAKRTYEGHRLRHAVIDAARAQGLPLEVMGRGYRPIEDKTEGLAPFRYTVVIENSREASYITEKLIDALRCRSTPIYWGAPDVGEIFDRAGIIECSSRDDILAALRQTSAEDYDSRRAAIEANAHLADHYADMHRRAAEIIQGAI
ncbi:glycosyltransferase family 10 domain-containing protein [Tabrizicola sp. M-4]|uniref:glycosyltransferase family 10 domain-containing protein n=1 Tax=Tabrizicola sp. M-4 TaxID=3055847 RepID=UPI003DA96802